MALKSQLLDVAIIEAAGQGTPDQPPPELPDGLDNLRAHNLLTYKSRHEALTAWVLDELIGHYVNYRKLKLTAQGQRHPPAAFGLYAVVTRDPKEFAKLNPLQPTVWEGVHDRPWGGHRVRVIVLNRIEQHPRNAAWELFASERDRMRQGLEHYRARHPHPSQDAHWELLEHLYHIYRCEVPDMAYTAEQILQDTRDMVIDDAIRRDPEAILKRFDPDDVMKRYDPEDRLKGLGPEDRLKGLDPATIEAWLAKQRRDR